MTADLRPRRSLGQCFLTDQRIARKILALAQLRPDDRVVEIGPGPGILTKLLAPQVAEVLAIEIDPRWQTRLAEELRDTPNARVLLGDALDYPFESIERPYKVVANLPYYIATPILFRLLEARVGMALAVVMLQREVVDRVVAGPGSKAYGPLSLAVAYAAQARKGFVVPAGCFTPKPKVDSAVVTLIPRSAPAIAVRDEALLFRVIRSAFAHRRKVLSNALKDGGFAPEAVARALDAAGIDPKRRGETLGLGEFGRLADAFV